MFTVDVVSLRQFYASPLGALAGRFIGGALRRLWPELSKDAAIALGYALPYLDAWREKGGNICSLMLGRHGAIYWPAGKANRTALVKETELPLPTASINRLLVAHTLEHARHVSKALEELWRVLAPGGRALLIVPNRTSLWTFAASTPFGCGQPFSIAQLAKRVQEQNFTLTHCATALYLPPVAWRWVHKIAPGLEWLGRTFFPGVGGVIVMEIEKQIYAAIPEPVRPALTEMLAPVGTPAMTRAGT